MHATETPPNGRKVLWLSLTVLAIATAGCTREPGGAPAGGATPRPETPAPSQSVSAASPEASVSAPTPAVMDPGEFWDRIGGGENRESFDSLGSIIRATDVVVVGTVSEFREGRQIKFPETGETMYMAEVRVEVSETLRGRLISPSDGPGTIVIESSVGFSPNPHYLAELEASTPIDSRVVLFLWNTNAAAARNGSSPDAPYLGEVYYILFNGAQGVIRDEAGTAAIGPGAEALPWLAKFKGRSFDQVIKDVRAETARAP